MADMEMSDTSQGSQVGAGEDGAFIVDDERLEHEVNQRLLAHPDAAMIPAEWSPNTRIAAINDLMPELRESIVESLHHSGGLDAILRGAHDSPDEAYLDASAASTSRARWLFTEPEFTRSEAEYAHGADAASMGSGDESLGADEDGQGWQRRMTTPPATLPPLLQDSSEGAPSEERDDDDGDNDEAMADEESGPRGDVTGEDDAEEDAATADEQANDEQPDEDSAPDAALVRAAQERGYYVTGSFSLSSPVSGRLRSLNDDCIVTLSSARPGNGVEELLANDVSAFTCRQWRSFPSDPSPAYLVQTSRFWQSDGSAPHVIVLQFYKRQSIAEISMFLPYPVDESYCPARVVIRAGYTMVDMEEVRRVDLDAPNGYVRISFVNPGKLGLQRYLRAHMIQIVFVSNHQQGRDCHVRSFQVLGPAAEDEAAAPRMWSPASTAAEFNSMTLR